MVPAGQGGAGVLRQSTEQPQPLCPCIRVEQPRYREYSSIGGTIGILAIIAAFIICVFINALMKTQMMWL